MAALVLTAAIVGCGSDDGGESFTPTTHRFTVDASSVIMAEGEEPEAVTGELIVSRGSQLAQYYFDLDVRRLRFKSDHFLLWASEGRLWAGQAGFGRVYLVATGRLNGVDVEISGYGWPWRVRGLPTELRGLQLQIGDDVTMTINVTRTE